MATADQFLDEPEKVSVDKFLDQGGSAPSSADSFLDSKAGIKDTVQKVTTATGMPMRGLRGVGVAAESLVTGDEPILSRENLEHAVNRGAAATEPGFEPQPGEKLGALAGEMLDPRLLPLGALGEVAANATRAQRLIAAAKVGGLFGLGSSSLDTLERKGTITMDDAEQIAKSGVVGAAFGLGAEAVLGPVLRRIFTKKAVPGEELPPGEEPPSNKPPAAPAPDYTPSAAARKARNTMSLDEVDALREKHQVELENLIKVRDQLEANKTALAPEAKKMLDEINAEVSKLAKVDKAYSAKQALKEFGIDQQELTPAKAEYAQVKAGEFRVAMRSADGKIKAGKPGELHGDIPRARGQESEAGYVDSSGKFYTREEAAKAINPESKPGDALHSPQLKDLTADQRGLTPEQVAEHDRRNVEQRDNLYLEKKLGDYNPAIKTDKDVFIGRKGMEHDHLITEQNLDIVADNVVEGYVDKDGKFLTKDEVLGPSEVQNKYNPERPRLINKWATEMAQAAKDLGYKTSDEAIAWAEKNNHFMPTDYRLALRNKFVSLIKSEPPVPLPPSTPVVSATPIETGEPAGKVLKASEMPVGEVPAQQTPVQPATQPTETPAPSPEPEPLNPWAEKQASAAKTNGAKNSKEAIEYAYAQDKTINLNDKRNVAYAFERLYGEKFTYKKAEVPDLTTLRENLPPEAGVNPDVADLLDASRAEGVGRKANVKIEAQYDATGQGWSSFRLKEADVYEPKISTEAELKIAKDTGKSRVAAETGVPEKLLRSSADLPGTDMAPAFAPEYVAGSSNFRQGWWTRVAKATQTALEGMGNSGKELAARIRLVDDASVIRANHFLYQFDKYIGQIPKAEWKVAGEALADSLEGRDNKYVLPKGMTEFVQKMFGSYADDAKALDFQIMRADGTKVPWAERQNFFPRVVKQEFLDGLIHGKQATLDRVKGYFLESKQASTEFQASQKVQALRRRFMERRYGHLERAREYDLPPEFYDRQGIVVIPEYVKAASHRLEEVRQFGLHDVRVHELLDKISGEGGDPDLARRIFDRYAGLEVSDLVHSRTVQGIKNLTTGMSIQLPSTLTQLGQLLTPIHRATAPDIGVGLIRAYGKAAKALIESFTTLGKETAAKAGQGFESVATDYLLDTYGGVKKQPFGKFAESSLKYSGFSAEDSFWRRFSAILGKDHIENTLIPRILRDGTDNYANLELRRLGLNPVVVRAQGGLSEAELNIATKRFADQTQGHPDVLNLPLWWSSPTGKFMTQFHTFSVVVGRENWLLAKNLAQTGNVNRLVSMGLGTPLVGAGISYLKEDVLGLRPTAFTGNKDTDRLIRWYVNGTSFGVAADLMLNLTQGRDRFTKAFQVPSAQILSGLMYDVTQMAHGDAKATKRVLQKTPVVGRALFQ